jgi:hypothetical protein
MWQSHSEDFVGGAGQKTTISSNGRTPTYAEAVDLWRNDDAFCSFFYSPLVDAPFEAYRWETPAVNWLSTAGMGVPWLHVRLDDRPKDYGHRPYRNLN